MRSCRPPWCGRHIRWAWPAMRLAADFQEHRFLDAAQGQQHGVAAVRVLDLQHQGGDQLVALRDQRIIGFQFAGQSVRRRLFRCAASPAPAATWWRNSRNRKWRRARPRPGAAFSPGSDSASAPCAGIHIPDSDSMSSGVILRWVSGILILFSPNARAMIWMGCSGSRAPAFRYGPRYAAPPAGSPRRYGRASACWRRGRPAGPPSRPHHGSA